MIVRWTLLPTAVLCVALVTATAAYFGGLNEAPTRFFGGEDVFIVGPPGDMLAGPQAVPRGTVQALTTLEGTTLVSAEALAPTVLQGRPVVVRAAEPLKFLEIESARVTSGRLPVAGDEMLVGARLARFLDLSPGDAVAVPGAFTPAVRVYHVVGVFDAPGATVDEAVVPLSNAPHLAGIEPGEVNLVRVRTDDPERLRTLLNAVYPEFTLSEVRLTSSVVAPGEVLEAHANVTNWGSFDGVYTFRVRENGSVVAQQAVVVPAGGTVPVSASFALGDVGARTVEINPTFRVVVRASDLHAEALPPVVTPDRPVGFRIVDTAGNPAAGAVAFLGPLNSTPADEDGRVLIRFNETGAFNLTLARENERGVAPIVVVAPENQFRSHFEVVRLHLDDVLFHKNDTLRLEVTAENRGGFGGQDSVALLVDDQTEKSVTFNGPPGSRQTQVVELKILRPGWHNVTAGDGPGRIQVQIWEGVDPRIQVLLEKYEREAASGSSPQVRETTLSADTYVDNLLGNARDAILFLAVATGFLASMGLVAALTRHLRERAPVLGVLKSVGASNEWILDRVTRELLLVIGAAAAVGLAAGTLLTQALNETGWVRAMGHVIEPALSWRGYALVFLLVVTGALAVAHLRLRAELAEPVDALLTGTPPSSRDPGADPDLVTLLKAREDAP